MKNKILIFIKILISVLLLIFCFSLVDYKIVLIKFEEQSPTTFLFASLSMLFAIFISSIRWYLIIISCKIKIKYFEVVNVNFTSYFIAQILPGGGLAGDVAKMIIGFSSKISKSSLLKSIVYDKLLGLLVSLIIFVLSIIFFILHFYSNFITLLFFKYIYVFLSFFLCMFFLIIFKEKILKLIKKLKFFDFKISNKYFYHCLALSFIIYLFIMISFFFICKDTLSTIQIYYVMLSYPIIHLIKAFPFAISGWGIREISTIYIFSFFEISKEIALSLSITYGVVILLAAFVGFVFSIGFNLFAFVKSR